MRVTNAMIANRVASNMLSSLRRFLEMQTQVSSGRRINKPSDDPLGVVRDLDYRNELAKNSQFQRNINQAQSWIQTYDTILSEVKDIASTAKEIAIAMANATYDDIAREASANEIKSLFEQLIQLANSEHEDKSVFSGFKTDQKALVASANGVRYYGDSGQIQFQVDSSTKMGINLLGSDVFLKQLSILGENSDLNIGLTSSTLLADLHNGQGIDQIPGTITITDQNLGITSTIDLSGATSISDILSTINSQLTADGITNLTATIGEEKNNILLDTTQNGLISNVTLLDNINNGSGVDLTSGKIKLTDGAAIDIDIDLSGASTIGDIISAFNTQAAAAGISNVTMQLNAAQTGFEIVDTNGVPLGLSITEADPNSSVASDLGITGDINPTLTGNDLNPQVSFKVDEAGGNTAQDLGLLAVFTGDYAGSDLDPMLTVNSNMSDLNGGLGYQLDEIVIWQGDMTRTIDFSNPSIITIQDLLDTINNTGLDITASINSDGSGVQIVNNDSSKSLTIEEVSNGRTAKDFGLYGSSDMLGSFIVLINALTGNDQEGTGMLLENFDDAIKDSLNSRALTGARGIRLESTSTRLIDQELMFTKRLSEVEDADITQLIIDLTTYENSYRASLISSSKIIQPTLLDFMK